MDGRADRAKTVYLPLLRSGAINIVGKGENTSNEHFIFPQNERQIHQLRNIILCCQAGHVQISGVYDKGFKKC